MSDAIDRKLHAYLHAMATLTPETVASLGVLLTEDVRYSDPFNDLRGVKAFLRVFERMFEDCIEPRFALHDVAISGAVAYARWRMTFRPRRWPGAAPWVIEGVSEIHLAADGRVTAHIDYWDAASQIYARFPVLGAILRLLRRRLSAE
jgi:steroid Delta-isomerase